MELTISHNKAIVFIFYLLAIFGLIVCIKNNLTASIFINGLYNSKHTVKFTVSVIKFFVLEIFLLLKCSKLFKV